MCRVNANGAVAHPITSSHRHWRSPRETEARDARTLVFDDRPTWLFLSGRRLLMSYDVCAASFFRRPQVTLFNYLMSVPAKSAFIRLFPEKGLCGQ